jgi:Peptidase A4 family
MLNRTTGLTTSVGFDPPAGVSSMGTSAEWIVEGISNDLPNFVLAGFHKCVAGTKTHRIDLTHPTETEIAGTSGDLTVAVAWLPETVLVLWEGYR